MGGFETRPLPPAGRGTCPPLTKTHLSSAHRNPQATAGTKSLLFPVPIPFFPVLHPSHPPIPTRSLKCSKPRSRPPTRARTRARIWCELRRKMAETRPNRLQRQHEVRRPHHAAGVRPSHVQRHDRPQRGRHAIGDRSGPGEDRQSRAQWAARNLTSQSERFRRETAIFPLPVGYRA